MKIETREIYHLKRRKLGITLQEIADYLRVHKSTVSRYETGKINFSLENEYKKYITNYNCDTK